jgi:hypothetical protein
VPAATLTALFCGGAILLAARRDDAPRAGVLSRVLPIAPLAAAAGFAMVGLIGNSKLASARSAVEAGSWQTAATKARSAERWAPWAAEPFELRAIAEVADRRLGAARSSFREAIAKDPYNWRLWFELAQVSDGAARHAALARALRLNPRGRELKAYRKSASATVGGG